MIVLKFQPEIHGWEKNWRKFKNIVKTFKVNKIVTSLPYPLPGEDTSKFYWYISRLVKLCDVVCIKLLDSFRTVKWAKMNKCLPDFVSPLDCTNNSNFEECWYIWWKSKPIKYKNKKWETVYVNNCSKLHT